MAGTSDTILRSLLCSALLLAGGLTAASAAEPVHGRSSELGIDFELAGDANWCDATVVVQLGSDQANVYQPDEISFLKMVGRIRAIINAQCPQVERILYVGFVGEQKVFAAEMTKQTRWRRFIALDPEHETPFCSPSDGGETECDKRIAAYETVTELMAGSAFADTEVTSVMEDRTDLHAAWQAGNAFGALVISHRSEHDGRYADSAGFADANIAGVVEACREDGGEVSRIPAADHGKAIAMRSVLCRFPGKPSRLNIILITLQDDWFYLFSLWGEEPHMAAANTMATRLVTALTTP